MRTAQIARKTNETDIQLSLNLDGRGESSIESGVGFLDHMLTLLSRHGRMDLKLTCRGDTYVDDHHSVEDVGIAPVPAHGRGPDPVRRGPVRPGRVL